MPKKTEIRIGGSGGQGVVLAAQILGKAAAMEGKNAVQTQAYGAEARGSFAKSEVIISDARIGFPAVRRPDILVVMSQESLHVLLKDLKEDGTLIFDSSNVKLPETAQAKCYGVAATETARKDLGDAIYANMIMLGTLTSKTGLVDSASVEEAIKQSVSKKTLESNINAFRRGIGL
jgi:2-oxoglutarate ferredoxin oxidoreductase subunit gamma